MGAGAPHNFTSVRTLVWKSRDQAENLFHYNNVLYTVLMSGTCNSDTIIISNSDVDQGVMNSQQPASWHEDNATCFSTCSSGKHDCRDDELQDRENDNTASNCNDSNSTKRTEGTGCSASQGRRRHLNLRGAGGSVVNRNSKFSSRIFAVVHVGISAWMFSVKWH